MNKARWQLIRRVAPGIGFAVVAPFVAYQVTRSLVDSDVTAFAIGSAVPVAWTLGKLAVTRKVDPIGVFSAVAFGVALLVTWLSGGSPIVLELRDAVPTAVLGLALAVSVLVRRPLTVVLLRFFGRWNPRLTELANRGANTAVTMFAGLLLLVHGAALAMLAFSVSTSTYVALSRPIGWGILGTGGVLLFLYRRSRSRPAEVPVSPANG